MEKFQAEAGEAEGFDMNGFISLASICIAAFALSGCATGHELNSAWQLSVGRAGKCRVIVHAAKTEQLETRTLWRGEGCAVERLDMAGVNHDY